MASSCQATREDQNQAFTPVKVAKCHEWVCMLNTLKNIPLVDWWTSEMLTYYDVKQWMKPSEDHTDVFSLQMLPAVHRYPWRPRSGKVSWSPSAAALKAPRPQSSPWHWPQSQILRLQRCFSLILVVTGGPTISTTRFTSLPPTLASTPATPPTPKAQRPANGRSWRWNVSKKNLFQRKLDLECKM